MVDAERRSLLTGFGWIAGYVLAIALVGHLLAPCCSRQRCCSAIAPALVVERFAGYASVILLIFFVDLLEPRLVLAA